jgi:hypothetical protein
MSKEFRDKIEEALRVLVDEDEKGTDYICSNWLIITEWADYEGSRYLHTEVSEAMTPWNAYGMMKMAQEYNSEVLGTKAEEVMDDTEEDDE